MNEFPTLVPSTRLYTPGDVPQSRTQSLSGIDASFRRGNRRIGQSLSLSFTSLIEAELVLLQQHYIDRQGTFNLFFLSPEAWSGIATPPVPLISDFAWRYVSPLTVSHASCGRFNVSVELEAEPIDTGDLVFNGGSSESLPARQYVLNASDAAASPARDYIIAPGGCR